LETVINLLPKIIRASLEGDTRTIESSSLSIIRKIKKEYPSVAEEISKALSFHGVGASVSRSVGIEPPPTDRDTFMSLARLDEPDIDHPQIVLHETIYTLIQRFLKEREQSEKLISCGLKPPTSILFYGPPGVGKTYLTRYIAYKLQLPVITLDLASSISSYLGKTGQNLKKVIEYAKSTPCILLLDEFDAIAKRRDDPTDLGELKRIVNVLLKELEDWPSSSVVVAATNHPDILDKAIWRRFDRAIEVPKPDLEARELLWKQRLASISLDNRFKKIIAEVTEGMSAADICQVADRILRQIILEEDEPIKVVINELKEMKGTSRFNELFARAAKDVLGKKVTQAQIADWLGISVSTVNHHLNKDSKDKEE
jgi:SpoVK/Ycf46/Vps4 family AAA+-type ATPase